MANASEVLVRVRLGKQDAKIIKRLEKVADEVVDLIEDMPWRKPQAEKIRMHLKYIAKHLKIEEV